MREELLSEEQREELRDKAENLKSQGILFE
jgi:hypothetical protein